MPTTVPAIEGWFTTAPDAALVGGECAGCGTFTFPRRDGLCPNPGCDGTDVAEVALSTRGTIWSYATNHYPPPEPAVVSAPYTVVAMTLEREAITVLGLLAEGADPARLQVGAEVELDVVDLFTDEDGVTQTVWAWSPVEVAP